MKVLIINGSPRPNGNTALACEELEKTFAKNGVETETVRVGSMDVRGCIACGTCHETGKCVFDDIVNELARKLQEADGLILATPVYFASANGTLSALCDRLFYSAGRGLSMKVGACVVVARRGGTTAAFDELNKYFTISGMPIASSCYWNNVHGCIEGEAVRDVEGMMVMRTLANNMTFLMRSIALGREQFGLPEQEEPVATNFIS